MNRLLPSPALSMALLVLWILLVQSLTAGTLLLGAGLALFWPAATARLMTTSPRLRKPGVAAALVVRVFADMLRSNLEVAWAILTRRSSDLPSGFVRVPLELRHPHGLAALSMIVTFTPGTAWAQLSVDRSVLLLHVLAVDDEDATVAAIKSRYERPLREIFE